MQTFHDAAAAWQNFYLLSGGAAATLIGLMFVAVTFGASLVTPETSTTARSFLDPVFSHFAQVLFTACLLTVPTMTPTVLAALLLGVAALRAFALVGIVRHMREAHRRSSDIELSDWISGVVVPTIMYLLLGATAALFWSGSPLAFTGLVVVSLGTLMNGLFGAWELMVWMAISRAQVKDRPPPPDGDRS